MPRHVPCNKRHATYNFVYSLPHNVQRATYNSLRGAFRRELAEQLSSAPALVLAVERDNAFSRLAALEESAPEVL